MRGNDGRQRERASPWRPRPRGTSMSAPGSQGFPQRTHTRVCHGRALSRWPERHVIVTTDERQALDGSRYGGAEMKKQRPAQVERMRRARRRRGRDAYEDGPAAVIPFGPPAPRTPADPPRSAKVVGGHVTKRRTLPPGLSMTVSIDVEDLARALLRLEEERQRQTTMARTRGGTRRAHVPPRDGGPP